MESGAEVSRVEETMVRMCHCFEGIEYADSYVTLTGIMFSLTYDNQTMTRICRVHTGEVDLNRIDQINTLSRRICSNPISVDELANELDRIKGMSRYTFKETMLFGAVGAAGFGMFFNGTLLEIVMSFFIGILIRCISCFLSKHKLNSFLNNAISAGSAALSAQLIHQALPQTNVDIMGADPQKTISKSQFLDIQTKGNSQKRLVPMVESYLQACGYTGVNTCAPGEVRNYFYLDDCIFGYRGMNYDICDFKSRNLFIPC